VLAPSHFIPTQPAAAVRAVVFGVLALASLAGCGRYAPGTLPSTRALAADAAGDGEAAVSPDGKSVAFVSDRGDNVRGLWVRSADGKGDPRPVVTGPGEVARPEWSRDGKRLLFTRFDPATGEGRAYIVDAAGGTPRALGLTAREALDATWSPDGGSVTCVVRADSTWALVEARLADLTVRPLFDAGTGTPPAHPTWGKQGVAYASDGDLWYVRPGGGAPDRLTSTAAVEADAAFSPDGKWLAFTSDSTGTANVWLARFTGGDGKKPAALGPWRPASASFQPLGHPAWSRDGKTLWFEKQQPWTVVAVDADGSHPDTLSSSLWDSREPSYVGTDTRVVFSSPRSGPWRVWLMAAAGEARSGPAKAISQGPRSDLDPDASNATGQVAYVDRNDVFGTTTLALTDAEGEPLGALTNVEVTEGAPTTRDFDPAWSPDGRNVAFASNRGGTPAIWAIEGVGRRVRLVTAAEGRVRTPRWTADGAAIVYSARGADGDVLWRVPAGGGTSTPLTEAARGEEDDEPAPSPDGMRIAFTRRHRGDRDLMLLENGAVRPFIIDPRGQDAHASWSSDGRRLVFETGGAVDLHRADVRPLLLR
jgi:Tol biopolymer transport system component